MKKIIFSIILLSCMVLANGIYENLNIHTTTDNEIKVLWDEETTKTVNTLEFTMPFEIKCEGAGNCGGRIDINFITKNNVVVIGKPIYTCSISDTRRGCTVNQKFRLYQVLTGDKKPTIQLSAIADADANANSIKAISPIITINPIIGKLKGYISAPEKIKPGDEFEAKVSFQCEGGVCFDVKIAPDYNLALMGEEVYSCGNLGSGQECSHYFKIGAQREGYVVLKGYASSYNPPETKKYTYNEIPIMVTAEETAEAPIHEGIQPQNKNVFEIIWNWIIGLF